MKPDKKTETKREEVISKLFPIVTIFLSIAVLILLWKIASYLIDERKSLDFWDELQDTAIVAYVGEQDREVEDEEIEDEKIDIPEFIDFDSLHEISRDAVAWLFSPGTKINYCIAQAEDNNYYLHRLLDGTTASGGTLFVDCRNSADFTDWNIIYTISWLNDAYKDGGYVKSKVTITDKLYPGVDFVKAGFIDKDGKQVPTKWDGCTAVYDSSHTVTWTLPDREAETGGLVYLIVRVNEDAYKDYHYNQNNGDIVAGKGYDDKVVNKARVTVVNGSDQYTNVPENPVRQNDPNKPNKPSEPTELNELNEPGVPKTGDDSNLSLWLALLGLCLTGLLAIEFYIIRKKSGRLD